MPQYTIAIFWPQGRESILIDFEVPLKRGSFLRTFEQWPGYRQPTEYRARVAHYRHSKKSVELHLEYLPEFNAQGQVSENESWGTSSLTIDLLERTVTAGWTEVNDSGPPVVCRAQLIEDALYEDLGHTWYKRRIRKQTQFRNDVKRYGARCALTSCDLDEALDAAHIIDADSRGGFRASNGLMLRADLHRLFDAGVLLILPDGSVGWNSGFEVPEDYLEASKSWKLRPEELQRVSKALAKRRPRAAA
jgi:hypothetical protein